MLSGVDSSTTYLWNFGDSTTSTLANPSHTFTTSGMYYVCLTVTNSSGCVATYCEPYYIDLSWWNNNPFNGNCTAGYIIIPNTSLAGTVIIVDVSQVNNANYVWNTSNGFMTNAPTPFFNLTGPGTFTLCATVTDTVTGCTDTFCDSLSIDSVGNVFKSNNTNMFSSASGSVGFIVMSAPKPSNINGIENVTNNTAFAIKPNPANNYVDINVNTTIENATMFIYNITGEIVKEEKIVTKTNNYRTAINELSNGTYFVKLNGNHTTNVVKLIVNH
jgi:PKD repeat protein